MKITFTWDDGAPEDQKLFSLHEKYGLPAMFFVPTQNCEGRDVLDAQTIRQAYSSLIRFGGHTATHRYLTTVPPDELDDELYTNKAYLEEILGEAVPHFCLPGGQYTHQILERVYRYFPTIRTADTMNFHNSGTLIKPTFHFYPRGSKSLVGNAWRNKSYGELKQALFSGEHDYFKLLRKLISFEAARRPDAQVVVWGHSWEIEQLGLWNELEQLMRWLAEQYPGQCVAYDALFDEPSPGIYQ